MGRNLVEVLQEDGVFVEDFLLKRGTGCVVGGSGGGLRRRIGH